MACYLQYRNLCKRVRKQLDELNDYEKAHKESSPHLSGATDRGERDDIDKDKPSDDDALSMIRAFRLPH